MSKKNDAFGDHMKELEMAEAGRKAIPGVPLLARLDGRAFHTFTRGFDRPFDRRFSRSMIETMRALVEEFRASIGYTQSDEITLLFPRPELLFGGRFQKLHSVLAGYASAHFAQQVTSWIGHRNNQMIPHFDCRVWQVPDELTALQVFIWREDDAIKNSIQMVAQSEFSHKSLHGLNSKQLQEKLFQERGINWNDYPASFKRGTYAQRRSIRRPIPESERLKIPERHRPEPGTWVTRTVIEELHPDPLRRMRTDDAIEMLFSPEEK